MSTRQYLPALRGRFGDWAYYITLMTLKQTAERIGFAAEIHGKGNLSSLIQRELKSGRATEIADYLRSNEDRFFNSLVVAVYGGDPQWHPFDVKPMATDVSVDDLDDTARYSVGYLSLTNEEKVFALDGQHRLAGIKKALNRDSKLEEEEISVIFVAHHNSPEGLRRTRKLFTTLNKQARPVKKSEIIALDESDVVAIVTRHLVENHPFFNDSQVNVLRKQANLAHGDVDHFTTIINLYDVVDLVLLRTIKRLSPAHAAEFKSRRPKDDEIAHLTSDAEALIERFVTLFPEVARYFESPSDGRTAILDLMRSASSGHVLFRPKGLLIFFQILSELTKKLSLDDAMEALSKLPTRLSEPPYLGTLWNSVAQTVDNKKASLCRDVLLYMLGHSHGKIESIRKRYATALGKNPDEVELPDSIVV